MASGSSGRASHSGSKAFDFGSDDILCSYEEYGNQDGNNRIHTDAKELNKSRVARSPVFPAATYSTPEESSFNEVVISTVENTMKKCTDNLMRFLEGLSSRLSQLELYCYNLDKSMGEMRSDLSRDHGESESKLKSLERHIQEVHRSVQILRDKQELADTQKELAKIQLASSGGNEERVSAASSSEAKKGGENASLDGHDQQQQQQLALALPHQVAPPQQPSMAPPQSSSILPPQSMAYYLPPTPQMTTNNNSQYLPSHTPHVQQQDLSRMAQPQANPQVVQSLSPYQQPQITTSSQLVGVYSSYQSPNMQKASIVGGAPPPQPSSQIIPYGYDAAGHIKITSYGPQSAGDGYVPSGPRLAPPPGNNNNNNNNNAYMVYDGEGGRTHHLPHFQQQNAYPPQRMPPPTSSSSTSANNNNNINMVVPHSSMRSHPYNELIDKLVGMGYRGDHVVAIIQRLDSSGQPVDFNSVLDMLNGGGASHQRGWRP